MRHQTSRRSCCRELAGIVTQSQGRVRVEAGYRKAEEADSAARDAATVETMQLRSDRSSGGVTLRRALEFDMNARAGQLEHGGSPANCCTDAARPDDSPCGLVAICATRLAHSPRPRRNGNQVTRNPRAGSASYADANRWGPTWAAPPPFFSGPLLIIVNHLRA